MPGREAPAEAPAPPAAPPSHEPPRRPASLGVRLERQLRPMGAPPPQGGSPPMLLQQRVQIEAPVATGGDAAPELRDESVPGTSVEESIAVAGEAAPAAAVQAPAVAEPAVRDAQCTPPLPDDAPLPPIDTSPSGWGSQRQGGGESGSGGSAGRSRPGARPDPSAAALAAANDAIQRLPLIRSRRQLIALAWQRLAEFEPGESSLLLLGTWPGLPRVCAALVLTALHAVRSAAGAKRLLLPCSPHALDEDTPLARYARGCGFALSGHDPLGQRDAREPAFDADARERAMRAMVADALHEPGMTLVLADAAHLSALLGMPGSPRQQLAIALVQRLAPHEAHRAESIACLLALPHALALRPAPALEHGTWCTPGFVERACAEAARVRA
jgi:hypothetical protein